MTLPIEQNVTATVPLLMVTSMEESLAFYVDGLSFTVTNRWIPDGHLRWVWMQLGGASLMLQEATGDTPRKLTEAGKLGNGVGLNFQCKDAIAIYRQAQQRGISGREPQVGNSLWEVSLHDPDGYSIHFASPPIFPKRPFSPRPSSENLPQPAPTVRLNACTKIST